MVTSWLETLFALLAKYDGETNGHWVDSTDHCWNSPHKCTVMQSFRIFRLLLVEHDVQQSIDFAAISDPLSAI